ncbi:MAG: hypothetical protein AB1546_14670 [bacterium]
MRWIFSFVLCLFALFLPWRLRHWFIKALAYWAQVMYFLYGSVIKILLRSLGVEGGKHE